jgi:hypothetical protein
MTARRIMAVALAALAFVAFVERTTEPPASGTDVLGATKERAPVVDAPCDVDGVTVDYEAGFRTSPGAPEYRIVRATVGDVAPTCVGASVSVQLRHGTTALATSIATASTTTVTLDFSAAPSARAVDGVAVQVTGGTVPVPAECQTLGFDRFIGLTAGNDSHPGSKDRDLTYGGAGNDMLRGDNQSDCLVGQGGNDQLFGDNHDDVLVGGDGDDVLTGGGGDDRLYGGAGFDRCIGGNGKNTFDASCEVVQ